ncbi:unnamed protein product [Phytophthora lilii]|uniref:Unnamed protein product n=1 Tax=Phytophthora lilii TaxID=2077276 RepID=A0A9W6TLT6_9STRA|nr:unnamed protein product [Phytophthora lilii]
MTKAVPPRRALLQPRDGNQEDAHAAEPSARPDKTQFPLRQQHSPDWDEVAAPAAAARAACRPTSLEELLDLELDLLLPATAVPAPMSNQLPVGSRDEETDVDSVSLELLVSAGDS